ncbi:MAG: hypothetical protein DWQ04_23295 [Chloroflexi bacterium]|nr:MAG: hypothetical protein DWQ04_23295 [Chloroflexota bacterium]
MLLKEASTTEQWVVKPPQTTELSKITANICHDAIEKARIKMKPKKQSLPLTALMQQRSYLEYFKFELAARVAQEIGANDTHVQAVYYFDPYENPDATTETELPVDPTVNLLVEVTANSPALKAYIEAIDKALTYTMHDDFPDSRFSRKETLTNVILITEDDIQNRRGYAAAIGSIYTPHRKIWAR